MLASFFLYSSIVVAYSSSSSIFFAAICCNCVLMSIESCATASATISIMPFLIDSAVSSIFLSMRCICSRRHSSFVLLNSTVRSSFIVSTVVLTDLISSFRKLISCSRSAKSRSRCCSRLSISRSRCSLSICICAIRASKRI